MCWWIGASCARVQGLARWALARNQPHPQQASGGSGGAGGLGAMGMAAAAAATAVAAASECRAAGGPGAGRVRPPCHGGVGCGGGYCGGAEPQPLHPAALRCRLPVAWRGGCDDGSGLERGCRRSGYWCQGRACTDAACPAGRKRRQPPPHGRRWGCRLDQLRAYSKDGHGRMGDVPRKGVVKAVTVVDPKRVHSGRGHDGRELRAC